MQLHSSTARRGSHSSRGVTLLEVVILSALLCFGLLALTTTSQATGAFRLARDEETEAEEALQTKVREITLVAARARLASEDWSTATIGALREDGPLTPSFAVPGLAPWDGEAVVGSMRVVVDETLTDDEIGAVLGMPQDLDSDGAIETTDVSNSADLLPFVVRLRWQGPGGRRELTHAFYATRF